MYYHPIQPSHTPSCFMLLKPSTTLMGHLAHMQTWLALKISQKVHRYATFFQDSRISKGCPPFLSSQSGFLVCLTKGLKDWKWIPAMLGSVESNQQARVSLDYCLEQLLHFSCALHTSCMRHTMMVHAKTWANIVNWPHQKTLQRTKVSKIIFFR